MKICLRAQRAKISKNLPVPRLSPTPKAIPRAHTRPPAPARTRASGLLSLAMSCLSAHPHTRPLAALPHHAERLASRADAGARASGVRWQRRAGEGHGEPCAGARVEGGAVGAPRAYGARALSIKKRHWLACKIWPKFAWVDQNLPDKNLPAFYSKS